MNIYSVVLGAVVLFAGRRLFWLLVGVVGFLAGMQFAPYLVQSGSAYWIVPVIGVCAGIVGALLAMLAERVAFALAGFFAGVYLVPVLAQAIGLDINGTLPVLIGGLTGMVLAVLLMDWSIVVLSSLVGAGAVAVGLPLEPAARDVVFCVLLVFGLLLQGGSLRSKK